MPKARVEAAHLLAQAWREIAELDWSLYALGKLPDPSVGPRLHQQLLTVRRLLLDAGSTPDDMPYLVCRYLVETDDVVLALRVCSSEIRGAIEQAPDCESTPVPSQERAQRVADVLAPMVRELIRRRNRCARDLGSSDYAALIVGSLDLDRDQLGRWLAQAADALAAPAVEGTPWLGYHDELDQRLGEAEALVAFGDNSIPDWAELLGIDPARLRRDLRTDTAIRGWCLPVDRPRDVRLVLKAGHRVLPLRLMLHEVGHYLHYTAPAPEQWPLFAPPPIFDETLAALAESAAAHLATSQSLGKLLLRPAAQDELMLHAAKQRRWALSALFELRAYRADGEFLDALWQEVLQPAGFAPTFPHEWALDRFYVDDPIYRLNYVVGFLWSRQKLTRTTPRNLQDVTAGVRALAEAAYRGHWRSALDLGESLPEIAGQG